ncbi:hypothetical protein C8R45DRAFT_1214781 [Mycena sanguinolenta]|nr:hypothetical protein C8R45DRAFT_1214781 [Mycena sanguinolenta]
MRRPEDADTAPEDNSPSRPIFLLVPRRLLPGHSVIRSSGGTPSTHAHRAQAADRRPQTPRDHDCLAQPSIAVSSARASSAPRLPYAQPTLLAGYAYIAAPPLYDALPITLQDIDARPHPQRASLRSRATSRRGRERILCTEREGGGDPKPQSRRAGRDGHGPRSVVGEARKKSVGEVASGRSASSPRPPPPPCPPYLYPKTATARLPHRLVIVPIGIPPIVLVLVLPYRTPIHTSTPSYSTTRVRREIDVGEVEGHRTDDLDVVPRPSSLQAASLVRLHLPAIPLRTNSLLSFLLPSLMSSMSRPSRPPGPVLTTRTPRHEAAKRWNVRQRWHLPLSPTPTPTSPPVRADFEQRCAYSGDGAVLVDAQAQAHTQAHAHAQVHGFRGGAQGEECSRGVDRGVGRREGAAVPPDARVEEDEERTRREPETARRRGYPSESRPSKESSLPSSWKKDRSRAQGSLAAPLVSEVVDAQRERGLA